MRKSNQKQPRFEAEREVQSGRQTPLSLIVYHLCPSFDFNRRHSKPDKNNTEKNKSVQVSEKQQGRGNQVDYRALLAAVIRKRKKRVTGSWPFHEILCRRAQGRLTSHGLRLSWYTSSDLQLLP